MSKKENPIVKKTSKYLEARKALREDLQPIYDRLVEDYSFFTFQRYGSGYVAYKVLADLVDAGWKREPT